jgi:hypothetical protein
MWEGCWMVRNRRVSMEMASFGPHAATFIGV